MTKTSAWGNMPHSGPGRYRRSDVFALKHRLSRCVDVFRAQTVLGVATLKEFDEFCRAASIAPVPWSRKVESLARSRTFELNDLERALARIREAGRTSPPSCPINWRAVARRAGGRRVIYNSDLYAALLSGRPQAYVAYPERDGLEALTFEEADVVRVLDELALPEVSGCMTLEGACQQLGLPEAVLMAFARRNPLSFREERKIVTTAFARTFASAYVCDRELAADTGATPESVRETLSTTGVDPEVEVDVLGEGVWAVYRRAKVDQSWERLEALLAADRKAISAEA
jgi:hypothetical protein